jgi:chemotaxis response regulator CheB
VTYPGADNAEVNFVLCDDDSLMRSMIETIIERQGHQVIGAADNTSAATELIVHGRPEAVVVDLSLGYNTDFDIIDVAMAVGARVIVFSHNASYELLDRFTPRPVVVPKPDFVELEEVIAKAATADFGLAHVERRLRPERVAIGPTPTGIGDAQAFYDALANAAEEDVLLSVEPASDAAPYLAESDATRLLGLVRATDRVLAAGSSVKVFLAGGADVGLDAFLRRLRDEAPALADVVVVRSIIIRDGEGSADAFDRLKSSAAEHHP